MGRDERGRRDGPRRTRAAGWAGKDEKRRPPPPLASEVSSPALASPEPSPCPSPEPPPLALVHLAFFIFAGLETYSTVSKRGSIPQSPSGRTRYCALAVFSFGSFLPFLPNFSFKLTHTRTLVVPFRSRLRTPAHRRSLLLCLRIVHGDWRWRPPLKSSCGTPCLERRGVRGLRRLVGAVARNVALLVAAVAELAAARRRAVARDVAKAAAVVALGLLLAVLGQVAKAAARVALRSKAGGG